MMKPQDIVILLKAFLWEGKQWTQAELAKSISMSASEVNHGLKRLEAGKLYNPIQKTVMKHGFFDLLVHAIKHIFPAELGPIKVGIPTSHAGPLLSKEIVFNEDDIYVWPDPKGKSKGQSLKPLYSSVPDAARNDEQLYELLTLVDALRAGYARERNFAKQFLKERLLGEKAEVK